MFSGGWPASFESLLKHSLEERPGGEWTVDGAAETGMPGCLGVGGGGGPMGEEEMGWLCVCGRGGK